MTARASLVEARLVAGTARQTWLRPLAWLPIPVLLLAMGLVWVIAPEGSYDSPQLMLALNVVFSTSVSALIAYLVARSFTVGSNAGLVMLGCGAIAWGAGGVVAAAAGQRDVNVVVTIHNLCVWMAGLWHLGAALSLRRARPIRAARLWLAAAYVGVSTAVALAAMAAVAGWIPVFFVQGRGGTPLRQIVLGSAVGMFALAAVLVRGRARSSPAPFLLWYGLALALVAAGLFGVLIESSHGSVLSWLGRGTQYLSGVYLLIAAVASLRESRAWGIPLEAALQDSESRYRALFESSLDAILVTAPGGQIIAANPAACALFGMSEEDFRRKGRAGLVDPEDPCLPALEQQRHAGAVRGELRYLRSDGSTFDAELSSIQIRSEGRAFDIVRDITHRKQAEEALRGIERESALRASEAKFRVLIERSMDMIIVLDAERSVRFWSPSATAALGWREAEVLGKSALELVHPDDEQEMTRAFQGLLDGPGGTGRVTTRFRHQDGSYRLVESVARNLLHDPVVQGVVVNSRDVTEQRVLEEQYRQAQKLESVGRLAGGVAHDFNNLLTVVLSCAEALKEHQKAGALPDPEDIEQIKIAGERARDLTRQLLAFARKQVIAPAPLDLNAVVAGTEKLMRRVLGEDVEVQVVAQAGLWPVLCDSGQIEQVLLNLAVNARDAMPKGGRLTIETRNVQRSPLDAPRSGEEQSGDWVRLLVRDSGCGMSPEVKAHIFEPFFTTKGPGEGTGLGLATVHGIVAQSGGRIRVESEPAEGATFEIDFPRSRTEAPKATAPQSMDAKTSGTETIFVVEDDRHVREVTVRSLRAAGYRVLLAGNGREAFKIATGEAGRVHLLVTDVVMPELDGRAVADGLRLHFPDLRVLFVSGYAKDAIARHGVLDPEIEFLAKPFTPASLLARVRSLLDVPPPRPRPTSGARSASA